VACASLENQKTYEDGDGTVENGRQVLGVGAGNTRQDLYERQQSIDGRVGEEVKRRPGLRARLGCRRPALCGINR
jgi:hypothetical protein